jgi:hypothetical protein
LVAAAAAGALIGCALGKIKDFERKTLTPQIAKTIASTLHSLNVTDDISAEKLIGSLEAILDVMFTILFGAASVVGGAVIGYVAGGVIGAVVGGTVALATYYYVGHN